MALKKSELYSSLWSGCDELRGGMDASQYKDYVLVLLFIKYVSDKYAGVPYAPITIPPGSSFKDMVALVVTIFAIEGSPVAIGAPVVWPGPWRNARHSRQHSAAKHLHSAVAI
jgi:hypothetical protein